MERHHREPAAGFEHPLRRRERRLQFVEFLVDENPQRLERPGGRMDLAGLSAHHAGDDVGKRARGRDRRVLARGDDGAGYAARMALLAENVDDVGKLGLGRLRDHVRRRRPVLPHPHVERTVETEGKAAPGLVELHGGDADVHHDAVDSREALRRANVSQVGKPLFDQRQPAGRALDQIEPAGNGGAVTVDADQSGSRDIEDRAAVAAGPEGGVDIDTARMRAQHLNRLAAENRNMARVGGDHAPGPDPLRHSLRKRDTNGPIAPQIPALSVALQCEKPRARAIADPAGPSPQAHISAWNLLDCHGTRSELAAPPCRDFEIGVAGRPNRFGSSSLITAGSVKKALMGLRHSSPGIARAVWRNAPGRARYRSRDFARSNSRSRLKNHPAASSFVHKSGAASRPYPEKNKAL